MKNLIICLISIALLFGSYLYPVIAVESKLSATENDSASSAELKSLLFDSVSNLSTYRYSSNVSSKIEINSDDPINKSNFTIISSEEGKINLTGYAISLSQRLSEISNDYGNLSMTNEMYLSNKTFYIRYNNKWSQKKAGNIEKNLADQNKIIHEFEKLNNSRWELLGFEEIEGEECYWIRVKPDLKKFNSSLIEKELTMSLENIDSSMVSIDSILEWTTWVTKDTHYLKKIDIKMILTFTQDNLEFPAKNTQNSGAKLASRMITVFSDYNQPILINFSTDFKNAYPFPIKSADVTIFGVIQDETGVNGYSHDKQKIYIDVAALGDYTVNLVDVEDRYYESNMDTRARERRFLTFELPKDIKVKKIRLEPTRYYQKGGSPIVFDLKLDQLGSVSRNTIERADFNSSKNDIYIEVYGIAQENDYYQSSESLSVDLVIDLKVTNNGANELPLDLNDFSLVDQFGWKYPASSYDGSSNLGSLLQGESRRFDLLIPDLSILSDPVILKYKTLEINVV